MKMFDRVLDRLAGLIGPGYLNHDAITRLCESGAVKGWHPDCINAASLS